MGRQATSCRESGDLPEFVSRIGFRGKAVRQKSVSSYLDSAVENLRTPRNVRIG